jgi:hypothetical protein
LILTAGTYDITQAITIEDGKAVSIIGEGDVTINLTSPTPGRALKIYDTSNVTISNINFTTSAAGNNPPTWGGDMGIDLSNACNVTLDNVSISGFGKFGVEVTADQTGTETYCPATNGVTFNNLSVSDSTGGIAFYDDSSSGVHDPISNVTFNGTTSISTTAYGIDINDAADVSGGSLVTSPQAQNLNLGTLNIDSVGSPIIAGPADRVVLANDSVINKIPASNLTASQIETALGLPSGVLAISGKPAATPPANSTTPTPAITPGVPNTGRL